MKTNEELQRDVQNAIKWEPLLKAAEIGVTVKNGIVTLSGTVDSYAKKVEAETAAKNVTGVKAVALDIEVRYGRSFVKNDTEIAEEILNSWRWNMNVPDNKIKVKVENGWVTLEGQLLWNYQREAAQKAINNLAGVKGISNHITIEPTEQEKLEKEIIQRELKHNWSLKNDDIKVNVTGHNVKLTGEVDSLYEKEEAGRIAWNTPGVWSVDNKLIVDFVY